jgi:hypothetical protein
MTVMSKQRRAVLPETLTPPVRFAESHYQRPPWFGWTSPVLWRLAISSGQAQAHGRILTIDVELLTNYSQASLGVCSLRLLLLLKAFSSLPSLHFLYNTLNSHDPDLHHPRSPPALTSSRACALPSTQRSMTTTGAVHGCHTLRLIVTCYSAMVRHRPLPRLRFPRDYLSSVSPLAFAMDFLRDPHFYISSARDLGHPSSIPVISLRLVLGMLVTGCSDFVVPNLAGNPVTFSTGVPSA